MSEPASDSPASDPRAFERWSGIDLEELAARRADVVDPDAVHDRALALEVWARGLVERERRLAEREARVNARAAALQAAAGVEPAWSLPSEPVARQIRTLILDTGDDVATVARGIGVEAEWAAGVLVGEVAEVDLDHIQRVCEGLHASPYDLWGVKAGRAIAHAYGPELWPRYREPLEPPPAPSWPAEWEEADVGGPDPGSAGEVGPEQL